jgi:hypothetical protein
VTVAHNRKLKEITFTLGGTSFECQVQSWTMQNNSEDGERFYTFCPDGEFREDAEPDYALELKFFSDWRSAGISDYLTANDQATVAFQLDHHPNVVGEHVRWTGSVKLRAPNVGGDSRTTEMTEVTLQVIGKPTYARI